MPAARKSQPRSGRSTSTALNPCTPSTQTTYWLRGTVLSPSRAAQISATGTRTPVDECTQVSATTLVRGVIPATSRSTIWSTVACAGSSYSVTRWMLAPVRFRSSRRLSSVE